jgi:hypothetical protein
MSQMAAQCHASHSAHGHYAAGRGGPWLAQRWIWSGRPMPAGVVRRAWHGHRAHKAALPLTAHWRPARGVLSSSSIVEEWPIRRAKLREEGRSREVGRREAVGAYPRRWRSWRNPTRMSTRCGSWCGTSSTGLHHGSVSKEREWR